MQKYYIKQRRVISATIIGSFFLLFLFSIAFFFPTADSPDEVSAATGFSNLSSSTLEVVTGHENAAVRLAIREQSGTFAASTADEEAKFTVKTDNFTGYTVSIKGKDDTRKLSNSLSGGAFDSITSVISESTFNTTDYNGKWGFKPSKYNSNANTQFLPSPTTTSSIIIDKTTEKNDVTANEYTLGVGARADYNTTSGLYSNTFEINVTTNPIAYAITYADASGDSTVRNLPPIQSSTTDSAKVTLSTQTPNRDNYRFLRWCLGTVENNGTTCNGTTFEAGGEFGLDQTDENIPTLYAVWSPNIRLKIAEGISNVNISGVFKNEDTGEYENTTKSCNITVDPDASTNGCVIEYLEYGNVYEIQATDITDGYRFVNWVSNGYGTLTDATSNPTNFTVGAGNTIISPNTDSNTYVIGLDNHLATVQGSTSAVATYRDTELSEITNPERHYNVSGFDVTHNNATGAVVTDAEDNPIPSNYTLTNSYEFAGWYYATNDNRMIITAAGELVASTPYTDAFGKWNVTYGATVYAGWGDGTAVRLPKISKTGYTCGWTDSDNNSSILWASGYEGLIPTADMELYGVCTLNTYNVTVHFASGGVSSVTFAADGQETKTVSTSDGKVRLIHGVEYTVTMNLAENFAFKSWSLNDDSYGNLTSVATNPTTFTPNIHSGSAVITASAIIMGSDFMQNLPYEECTEEPKALIDSRDGQTYMVQRLKDGNCWMMDSLNLGAEDLSGDLNSDNTNLADGVEPISAATFNSWRRSGSYIEDLQTYDDGRFITLTGSDETSHTKYGTLYNYAAASAGTIKGETNSVNATSDICPAGWRLPTGSGDSAADFNNVYQYYHSNADLRSPAAAENGGVALGLSGQFVGFKANSRGALGVYWSSTRQDDMNMYGFQITTSSDENGVVVNKRNFRDYGYSVRCILTAVGQTIPVSTLQDFNTMSAADIEQTVDNMEVGKNYSLADARDGQLYTISKMKDGNVWMTKNLNLGDEEKYPIKVSQLDSTNTNMDENATPMSKVTFVGYKNNSSATYNKGNYKLVSGSDTQSGTASGTPFGALYNYYLASVGTIKASSNYQNAQSDICPAGWRLPVSNAGSNVSSSAPTYGSVAGSNINEFQNLYTQYNSWELMRSSIATGGAAFALAGGGTTSSTVGAYWSSTWYYYGDTKMKYMEFFQGSTSNKVDTDDALGRDYLASIRCILRTKKISDIRNMQEFKNLPVSRKYDVASSMTTGRNYDIWDVRDDENNYRRETKYTIAKLPDDRIWMTENLRLGFYGTTDLTSDNTNLAEGVNPISLEQFDNFNTDYSFSNYNTGVLLYNIGNDPNNNTRYGILYNYYVASATTVSSDSDATTAMSDICPAGWQMPYNQYISYSNSYIDYDMGRPLLRLINFIGSTNMYKPVADGGAAMTHGGTFDNTQYINNKDSVGYYWQSSASSSSSYSSDASVTRRDVGRFTTTNGFYANVGSISNGLDRKSGAFIRCVARWD